MEILTHPFVLGFLAGLILTVVVWINSLLKQRVLAKDNRELREHLHRQMTIDAKGNQDVLQEIERLKKFNENLKISLATLKGKPDKAELRTLYLYDKALHLMYEKAPGFAPAWEAILKEADAEMEKLDSGIIAWVRKAIRPSLRHESLSYSPHREEQTIELLKDDQKTRP